MQVPHLAEAQVRAVLNTTLTGPAVDTWLSAPHAGLGCAPCAALAVGRGGEVLAAAEETARLYA